MRETTAGPVDRLVALKFPAYLLPHPNKVIWLMHQHRSAYDLWEHPLGYLHPAPRGRMVRDIIRQADGQALGEARAVFTISRNVTGRLRSFSQVESVPLYHPPAHPEAFYCADEIEDYFFFPSRLSSTKRQDLVLRSLAITKSPVRIKFAGLPDRSSDLEELKLFAHELGVESRVEWMAFLSEEKKRDVYAHALAVLFPPLDEDYGYVTLEAMLSSKAVITCIDSGGTTEFVLPRKTGLVTSSATKDLAEAMDLLWEDRPLAKRLGLAGREHYDQLGLSWSRVVKELLA
jgi:glycosyltransferase involved in cell wall biosynthesis